MTMRFLRKNSLPTQLCLRRSRWRPLPLPQSPTNSTTHTHRTQRTHTHTQSKQCAPSTRYFGCATPNPQCQQGEWLAGVCLVPGGGRHQPHSSTATKNSRGVCTCTGQLGPFKGWHHFSKHTGSLASALCCHPLISLNVFASVRVSAWPHH